MKKFNLILISLILLLLSVGIVNAVLITDTLGFTYISDGSGAFKVGLLYKPVANTYLMRVDKDARSTGTTFYLINDTDGVTVNSSSWTGNTVSTCWLLKGGQVYRFLEDAGGSSLSFWGKTSGVTYPIAVTGGNFTGSWAGGLSTTTAYQIVNITTDTAGCSIPVIPPVVFVSQVPSDITSASLFSTSNVNITYSIVNVSGLVTNGSSPFLNYTILNVGSCWNFQNGSCQRSGFVQSPFVRNVSSSFLFQLGENNIYPLTSNAPSTLFNQSHSRFSASGNSLIKWQFLNFSTLKNTNYLEADLLSADSVGNSNLFVCNSTYTTGNPTGNANCVLINSFTNVSYNHSHFSGLSNHSLFLLPVNVSSGLINNVLSAVDGVVWVVFRGATVGSDTVGYVLNSSRVNSVQTSVNGGIAYSSQGWTVDSHIHQFNNTEVLTYSACGQNSTGLVCDSTFQSDNLGVTVLPPTSVTIISPNSTYNNFTRYVNISYTASTPSIFAVINRYNISLFTSSEVYVTDVRGNNSLNLNYTWDTYSMNLTPGSYQVHVRAFDNFSQSSDSESSLFTLNSNAVLNITAFNITVANNISTFNISLFDLNTSITVFVNTSSGVAFFDIVKGHTYNVSFSSFSLASINQVYVASQSAFQTLSIATGPNDAVKINIYNEVGGALILQNVSIVLTNLATTQQYSYVTNTGLQISDSLVHGSYSLTVSSSSPIFYFPRFYNVVVNNNFQNLNVYLAPSNNSILFNIKTSAGIPIQGMFIQQFVNVNGSVVVAQSAFSDVSGKALFSYVPFTFYSFLVNGSGYQNNSFILNPILFPSYDVIMQSSTQGNVVPTAFVMFGPTSFFKGQVSKFNFTIASTYNGLVNYRYNLDGPNMNINHSGVNINGESFSNNFSLNNVSSGQVMTLYYEYLLSNGVYYNRTIVYPINIPLYNQTLMSLGSGRDFGFGLGDKVLIVVLLDLICFGVGFAVFGPIGGLGLVLANTGIWVAVGFVPAFMFYAVFVIAVFYMIGRGVDNG